MDELIQILFTIGIILFATISGIKKRARQAMSESEEGSPEEQLPEGWPMQGPAQELPPATAPAKPKRMPQQSAMHPDSREQLISEIDALKREKEARRKSALHPAPHKPIGTREESSSKEELQAEKHPLTADFELRKAVIWSEILKPKFDE